MEQKTTDPGRQAEPREAPQPTPWCETIKDIADAIGADLDEIKGRRGFIVVAVDATPTDEGKPAVTAAGLGGDSIALGLAVKHVLTAPAFAKHMATAARMLAIDAAARGKGAIVVKLGEDGENNETEDQEQPQEGDGDGE